MVRYHPGIPETEFIPRKVGTGKRRSAFRILFPNGTGVRRLPRRRAVMDLISARLISGIKMIRPKYSVPWNLRQIFRRQEFRKHVFPTRLIFFLLPLITRKQKSCRFFLNYNREGDPAPDPHPCDKILIIIHFIVLSVLSGYRAGCPCLSLLRSSLFWNYNNGAHNF